MHHNVRLSVNAAHLSRNVERVDNESCWQMPKNSITECQDSSASAS